jgi:hypothetical protein
LTCARRRAGGQAQENKLLEAGRSFFKARPKDGTRSTREVLRVLRDRLTGRLIVEIAGRRYTQVGDIEDRTFSAAS